jgi:hypothetical protein
MANPLDFLLPRPRFRPSRKLQAEFDTLFDSTPAGSFIDYQLNAPRWQFLSYLCQTRDLVLHGSQNQDIEEVVPRKAQDTKAFSNQNAIYATTDGIWVIYFAIVDRKSFGAMSLFNSCLDIQILPKLTKGPLYFFSITHSVLVQKPWCDGVVYILPRTTFEQEPPQFMLGAKIIFPHWISPQPIRPIAKLRVTPQDFPFLAQIHGHDDEKLAQLAAADPNGFPWPDALVI